MWGEEIHFEGKVFTESKVKNYRIRSSKVSYSTVFDHPLDMAQFFGGLKVLIVLLLKTCNLTTSCNPFDSDLFSSNSEDSPEFAKEAIKTEKY